MPTRAPAGSVARRAATHVRVRRGGHDQDVVKRQPFLGTLPVDPGGPGVEAARGSAPRRVRLPRPRRSCSRRAPRPEAPARPLSAHRAPGGRGAGDACPAICCACARVPPADRYAVIPVARNVWQHVEGGSPAAAARRLIIAKTTRRCNARPVSRRPTGSTLWKSAALGSSIPPASTYSSRAAAARWWAGTSCRRPPSHGA